MKSSILNNKNLKIDKKAKCVSFFVKNLPFSINKKNLNEMMKLSDKNKKSNVRICFHKSKDDIHHDMIILERNKNVYPPHRHKDKGECFHVILGKLKILIFNSSGFKKFSLLIIVGGAIGNFYDRATYRAVPDFIDFHVGNFHWFIFNIADIFITIGVIFMILIELTSNNKEIRK